MEDRTLLATMLWSNAAGGDWGLASNWVNSANATDHHVPTASDDAVIDLSGITVTHTSSTANAVKSLTSEAAINLSSGSLSVATTAMLQANLTLNGGKIIETGRSWAERNSWAPESGGTLNGVTVNGNLDLSQNNDASLTVQNGLVLNGTMDLGNASGSTFGYVNFGGSNNPAGSLTGNATVLLGGSSSDGLNNYSNQTGTAGTLTIGPNVTIHGNSGYLWSDYSTNAIVNQGTINADTAGGTIQVYGSGTSATRAPSRPRPARSMSARS